MVTRRVRGRTTCLCGCRKAILPSSRDWAPQARGHALNHQSSAMCCEAGGVHPPYSSRFPWNSQSLTLRTSNTPTIRLEHCGQDIMQLLGGGGPRANTPDLIRIRLAAVGGPRPGGRVGGPLGSGAPARFPSKRLLPSEAKRENCF